MNVSKGSMLLFKPFLASVLYVREDMSIVHYPTLIWAEDLDAAEFHIQATQIPANAVQSSICVALLPSDVLEWDPAPESEFEIIYPDREA